jgi:hypothetical protein
VGKATNSSLVMRAYRYQDASGTKDLGAGDSSVAFGINNAGDVVGMFEGSPTRGFLYYSETHVGGGVLLNLDNLVANNSQAVLAPWTSADLIQPAKINNAGWVCGWTRSHAFLLTPIH